MMMMLMLIRKFKDLLSEVRAREHTTLGFPDWTLLSQRLYLINILVDDGDDDDDDEYGENAVMMKM